MAFQLPSAAHPNPTAEPSCLHRQGCTCRRPSLGRALVTSVVIESILAVVTVAAGAPAVGLVACAAIAWCMMVAVVAEVVAFYRIGLDQPHDPAIGRNRGPSHRPGQSIW